jgi:hypothetical protein
MTTPEQAVAAVQAKTLPMAMPEVILRVRAVAAKAAAVPAVVAVTIPQAAVAVPAEALPAAVATEVRLTQMAVMAALQAPAAPVEAAATALTTPAQILRVVLPVIPAQVQPAVAVEAVIPVVAAATAVVAAAPQAIRAPLLSVFDFIFLKHFQELSRIGSKRRKSNWDLISRALVVLNQPPMQGDFFSDVKK